MKGVKHFKTRKGYLKWLAYGHMHGSFKVKGNQKVFVGGKPIKVKHKR